MSAGAAALALAMGAGEASGQGLSRSATDPGRFAASVLVGASTFTADTGDHPSSADVAVGGQVMLGPQFSGRVQVGAQPSARVTLGIARHLQPLADPHSYLSVEVGLAFIHGLEWEHGAYAGTGVQFTIKGPVALSLDGRVYVTQLNTGFSLLLGTKVHF